MERSSFFQLLIPKDRDLEAIGALADENAEIISYLLEGIDEKNARIKYGCMNTLVLLSQKNPTLLYPHFEVFPEYLQSDQNIKKLSGIKILCNLSWVDSENKVESVFEEIYSFITDFEMTPAAEVAKGSISVVESKPHLSDRVISNLLKVAETSYKTPECKNILTGHVINTLDKIYNHINDHTAVFKFVEQNLNNPWPATSKKAGKFLERHSTTV